MSITATVENNIIKLPENTGFADGVQVRVELIESTSLDSSATDWIEKSVGIAKSGLSTDPIMSLTRGKTLPGSPA